jgi:hypothetical protein
MKALRLVAAVMLVGPAVYAAKAKPQVDASAFYIYSDRGARTNHFAPSGWMGDYGDLGVKESDGESPIDGRTDIKVTYSAKGTQGANWAGIFWQQPPNNWGDKPGGYDLSAYKRLTFWAKSPEQAKIAEFKVGGITGEHGDSDAQAIGPIELTKDWKKYTIELADKSLIHIVGGFCFSASRDDNPNGYTLYLDEIRFEK